VTRIQEDDRYPGDFRWAATCRQCFGARDDVFLVKLALDWPVKSSNANTELTAKLTEHHGTGRLQGRPPFVSVFSVFELFVAGGFLLASNRSQCCATTIDASLVA
jgi:hypothetical protein